MKRIAGLVLVAVLGVLAAPVASAEGNVPRTPVGLGASGVHGSDGARGGSVRDIPDIEWPPPGVEPPGHSRDVLIEYSKVMEEHLNTAYPAAVPEANNLRWVEWGGEFAGIIEDGQDYLTTWAVYEDEIGRTATAFQVEAPGHFTTTPRQFCEQTDKCWATFLDDGSLLLRTLLVVQGNRPFHVAGTLHYRNDGTVVWVLAYDYDPIWDGNEGPDRDEVALTYDQLATLATDPALHL